MSSEDAKAVEITSAQVEEPQEAASQTQDQSAHPARATLSFAKSLGSTLVTSHPLWLMAEAISPGKKVGSGFNKHRKQLFDDSIVIGNLLRSSASDVVVIVNERFNTKNNEETSKTAKVIKDAGENALVVVTTSIESARKSLEKTSPGVKKALTKHGREAIIVIDKSLKNPIVISGIDKFAKSKGIPGSAAILQIASLALSRLLAAIPLEEGQEVEEGEVRIHELDATELDRTSSQEAETEATAVGNKPDGSSSESASKSTGSSKCCIS